MTEARKRRLRRMLQESRFRIKRLNYEFGEPLDEMIFVATKEVKRISTNGKCIYFDADWMQKLGDIELDFILSHQLMHMALGHIERPKYYKGERFHLACDIVANSHLEVLGWKYDKLPHIGRIFYETFFPAKEGRSMTSQEALKCVPFDPATMAPAVRRNYMIDSEEWWDQKEDCGERGIVVLSPDDEDPEDLYLGEARIGGNHFFVPKEIYIQQTRFGDEEEKPEGNRKNPHLNWDRSTRNELQSLRNMKENDAMNGFSGDFTERVWQRVNVSNLDWRKLLNNFVQADVCDYSFMPPDRRMQDLDFFLPDFNVTCERPMEVLFFVDTSGSVEDEALSVVYGEICNALSQFHGGIVGTLIFFDSRTYKPISFSDISDLLPVIPQGGGGTNFQCVFDYIRRNDVNHSMKNIVIFTDGRAPYPNEREAYNIPVLWLLTERSAAPEWGKVAYVDI